MMETSKEIVSCYPVNSYVAGFWVMKEFTFGGMKPEGQIMKVINLLKEFKILFFGIVYKAT